MVDREAQEGYHPFCQLFWNSGLYLEKVLRSPKSGIRPTDVIRLTPDFYVHVLSVPRMGCFLLLCTGCE